MIKQAMILAAGKGTRMQPLTLTTPKPLVCVANKPLIVWHIEALRQAGIQRIVINAGYLADKMTAFFHHHDFGVQIKLSVEKGEPLETAGGIKKALTDGLLNDEPFVLVNGDVWSDVDRRILCQKSLGEQLGHLYLVDNPEHNKAGDFVLSQGYVADKTTKPRQQTFTFSGLSLLSPRLVDEVAMGQVAPLAPFLRQAMACQKITGDKLPEGTHWVDVGTIERLNELEQYLMKKIGDKRNV